MHLLQVFEGHCWAMDCREAMNAIGRRNRVELGQWDRFAALLQLSDEAFDFIVDVYRRSGRVGTVRERVQGWFHRFRGHPAAGEDWAINRIFTEIATDEGTISGHWDGCAPDRRWAIYGMTIPINMRVFDGERLDERALRIAARHSKDDGIWRLSYEEFMKEWPDYAAVQRLHFVEHRSL